MQPEKELFFQIPTEQLAREIKSQFLITSNRVNLHFAPQSTIFHNQFEIRGNYNHCSLPVSFITTSKLNVKLTQKLNSIASPKILIKSLNTEKFCYSNTA